MSEKGLRFNEGKTRKDLLPNFAITEMSKVLTAGSLKYADRNWEKGMPWTEVMASLKRHIAAWENGEDYDPETGELHVDHMQCNTHFLSAYYSIAPEFDGNSKLTSDVWLVLLIVVVLPLSSLKFKPLPATINLLPSAANGFSKTVDL